MRSFDVAQERKCGASMRFELTRNCSRKENLLNITPRRDAPKRMNICNDLIEKKYYILMASVKRASKYILKFSKRNIKKKNCCKFPRYGKKKD